MTKGQFGKSRLAYSEGELEWAVTEVRRPLEVISIISVRNADAGASVMTVQSERKSYVGGRFKR